MAPKNLLRYIFRHGPHAKAAPSTGSRTPRNGAPSSPTTSTKNVSLEVFQKQSTHDESPRTKLMGSAQSEPLLSVKEADEDEQGGASRTTSLSNSEDAGKSAESLPISKSARSAEYEILLRQAKVMAVAHLNTIETALTLINALENMSPHMAPMREHIIAEQGMCRKKLARFMALEGSQARSRW